MQYIQSFLQVLICLSDYEKVKGGGVVIMLYHMSITCISCVCHITHVQESREVVVFRLLDKIVATELVSPTVQSKVLPYVQRHGLKVDEVLLQYVEVGCEYENRGYSFFSGFRQLLVIKSWMGTRLGVEWWLC